MAVTKDELISALKNEVRIFLHLCGKVEPKMLDYRPTRTQRTALELIQYMAIMGPTQLALIEGGVLDRATLTAAWRPAESGAKQMNFDAAVAAIEKQAAEYQNVLGSWTEEDFRREVDLFGNKMSRGLMVMNMIVGGFAAYRTQLFCYLKSCGRDELGTMNLWAGSDAAVPA